MLRLRTVAAAAVAMGMLSACSSSSNMPAGPMSFGNLKDGKPVHLYTLTNAHGVVATVSDYGGTLVRLQAPDKSGKPGDVLLSYETVAQYQKDSGPYFGAIVGRVANRIAKGTFTVDGQTYHVPVNNGPNSLHGGLVGYDKRVWSAEPMAGNALKLTLTDVDTDQGYPGTVKVSVVYTLTDDDTLRIQYEATTDKATPINLTNHSYWNLKDGGKSDVKDEVVHWNADKYLPVDDVQIPTGEIASVDGTPFDFRTPKPPIGQDLVKVDGGGQPGYDHNYCINGKAGELRLAMDAYDPTSGRTLTVSTTEPGMQFYTSNFLDGSIVGRGGAVYGKYHGFAVEAQDYPDAVNHPNFPNSILRPGETYRQTTEYKFGTK